MSDGRISISIGADVGNALSGLQKVNTSVSVLQVQFDRLQKLASMPNLSFRQQERLNQLLSKTGSELSRFQKAAQLANPAIERFARSNNQASASLFNFGRIVQDAPYAVLAGNIGAIANNIDPLVESFGRLRQTTGSAGGALKAMAGSLIGPAGIGIAISAITSALVLFGDELFKSKAKVSESALANERFALSLKQIEDRLKAIKEALDFGGDVGRLQLELSGLSGSQLEIADASRRIKDNNILIGKSAKELTPLQDQFSEGAKKAKELLLAFERLNKEATIRPVIETTNFRGDIVTRVNPAIKQAAAIKDLANAYKELFDFGSVGETTLEALSKKDRAAVENLLKLKNSVDGIQKDITRAAQENTKLTLKIGVEGNKETKRLQDERLKEYEKWVSETIASGQALADFFKDRRPVPIELIQDSLSGVKFSREEQLKKSLEFIQQVKNGVEDLGTSNLRLPLTIEPIFQIERKDLVEQFKKAVKEIQETALSSTGLQDLKLPMPTAIQLKLKEQDDAIKRAKELNASYASIAETIGGLVTPAVGDLINAITKGENVIEALGNTMVQTFTNVVKKLAEAAALAGIISLITGGASGGGKSFIDAFLGVFGVRSPGGVAGLGLPGISTGSFVPTGSGRSSISPGNISVSVSGQLVGRGNDLIGVLSTTTRQNNRVG